MLAGLSLYPFVRKDTDHIPELPKTVTRIAVQKKNTSRFSLYDEDEFITGVSDAVLTRFNIRKGTEVTHEFYMRIKRAEELWAVREYFLRLLGRRDHASHELRLKARKKDYPDELINECLAELEMKGYINNRAFAEKFASDKFEFNQWGPGKIRSELIRKGVDKKTAAEAVQKVLTNSDIVETMEQVALKKKRKLLRDEPAKRKKKLFDFLLRKGYDSSVILSHIDRLLAKIEA